MSPDSGSVNAVDRWMDVNVYHIFFAFVYQTFIATNKCGWTSGKLSLDLTSLGDSLSSKGPNPKAFFRGTGFEILMWDNKVETPWYGHPNGETYYERDLAEQEVGL